MISDALEFIRREVRDHLGVSDSEVSIDSARALAENETGDGALITLVNIEEEPALRNTPFRVEVGGRPARREPSVFMNLYLLFSFDFQNYGTSLLHLSNTIALFQHRRFLSAENETLANSFPEGLQRLIFEHHNMSFEALNNLWSVMGGALYPSVIYKVRLVEIRHEAPTTDVAAVTTIQVDTVRR